MKEKKILVTKISGEQDDYDADKLKNSLKRSGASKEEADLIEKEIQEQLYEGISTKIIYKRAFDLLRKKSEGAASRYKLKNAIMEFGPSGYPFEKYVGEIFKAKGYKVKIGEIVSGNCVNHEVDVLAEKEDLLLMIECKYHLNRGLKSDVKIPLYIKSRFDDLYNKWTNSGAGNISKYEGWVFTNTKFTNDAITYGRCVGLHLVGWNYPEKDSLRELIDQEGLYPITCLSSLSVAEKQQLLDLNVVLCRQLLENERWYSEIMLNRGKKKNVTKELNEMFS